MNEMNPYTNWLEGNAAPPDAMASAMDSRYSPGPRDEAVRRAETALRKRLSEHWAPIYYDRVEQSPLGPLWVAAGAKGLVAVEYDGSEKYFLSYLTKISSGRPQRSAKQVAGAVRMLLAYLRGERSNLDLDVDLSGITPFQQDVLQATRQVPRGQVASYAEIARRIGKPKAVRAVGQALRRNPIPIVVPCHRIIASDGSLGGYAGELRSEKKAKLLRLEGVSLA